MELLSTDKKKEYRHALLNNGYLEPILEAHSVKQDRFLKMQGSEIRQRFSGEPIRVVDRLVSIVCANRNRDKNKRFDSWLQHWTVFERGNW